MYYQFMYINMCGFWPPNISLLCIHVSIPIDAVFCSYVCACVSWHRNGFMLCFASQKKKKQIAHASLSNFSIFLFLFFSTTGQKGNAYVACCFPSNWIDWMVDRSIVNKQDWSKCRTRRQLNSLDLRTTLWFNGFQKGVSS